MSDGSEVRRVHSLRGATCDVTAAVLLASIAWSMTALGQASGGPGAYQSEGFTVRVHGRDIVAKIVSPPKDRLAKGRPLLMLFVGARDLPLFREPFCLPGDAFLEHGHRVVSFQLPAIEERIDPKYGEGITGWRNAFVAGEDVFAQFVDEGRAVISECIRRGWATPGRIAVNGGSRCGYMALRLLAADDRIAVAAVYAPVTDWRYLAEFTADREREDVARLALVHFVRGMVGKPVYIAIGGTDPRVNAESCRRFAERLMHGNDNAGRDASLVEFHLTDDREHAMGDQWYRRAADFLLEHTKP